MEHDNLSYYHNLELKPGIKFYQALCRLNKPIHKYELRIPQTYFVEERKLLVYDESKGYLTRVEELSIPEYQRELEHEALIHTNPHSDNPLTVTVAVTAALDQPAYLIRKRFSMYDYRTYGVSDLLTEMCRKL